MRGLEDLLPIAARRMTRSDDQLLIVYSEFNRVTEAALLNQGLRNANTARVADAYEFDDPY
jgi:hypothetical protein